MRDWSRSLKHRKKKTRRSPSDEDLSPGTPGEAGAPVRFWLRPSTRSERRGARRALIFVEDKDGRRNGGGPQPALVAHGRLGHVAGANDLVGDAIDLLLL